MSKLAKRSAAGAVAVAVGVCLLTATAIAAAFDPDRARTVQVPLLLGAVYGPLALVAVGWLRRTGQLRRRLAPAYGDVTKGFLTAAGLFLAAFLLHHLITGRGSFREPWVMRAYLQVGDPFASGAWAVAAAVLAIAACEEITWRGGVMTLLAEAFGARRAWLLTTVLYGLSYAPTVYLLRDPLAGPNPLLVVAALVGGAVWGGLVLLFGRVPPVVIGHALLVWALVAFPLWRP